MKNPLRRRAPRDHTWKRRILESNEEKFRAANPLPPLPESAYPIGAVDLEALVDATHEAPASAPMADEFVDVPFYRLPHLAEVPLDEWTAANPAIPGRVKLPIYPDPTSLAEFLHPWLDGARGCPFEPHEKCPNFERATNLAATMLDRFSLFGDSNERDSLIKAEAWDAAVSHCRKAVENAVVGRLVLNDQFVLQMVREMHERVADVARSNPHGPIFRTVDQLIGVQ